jgi:hypothetical protein
MASNQKKKQAELARSRKRRAERRQRAQLVTELGIGGHDIQLVSDYYITDFLQIHQELASTGAYVPDASSARWSFWQSIPVSRYGSAEGAELIGKYLERIEDEMRRVVSEKSIAYWLHLLRRLSPGAISKDSRPGTIRFTRATLEAAVQKWGRFELCGHIAKSTDVPSSAILQGRLEKSGQAEVLAAVKVQPQLVLTDFGPNEMLEVLELEKLAYECWKSMAKLRALGKGAMLEVTGREDDPIDEYRERRLDLLIKSYDERTNHSLFSKTATGTVFLDASDSPESGGILLPRYNVEQVLFEDLRDAFESTTGHGIAFIPGPFRGPNFVWSRFSLRTFFDAHKPFSDGFRELHGVTLESVLAILATVCTAEASAWAKNLSRMWRSWQRAYDGPVVLATIAMALVQAVPKVCEKLRLPFGPSVSSLEDAVGFLTLKKDCRDHIDIAYPGPHYVFLPCGDDRMFVDLANIWSRMYLLFHGVKVSDQNFKGDALEAFTRQGKSALPTSQLRASDGTSRQIDVSVKVGDLLVIGECRANAWSIGMERGDPKAIEVRRQIVERALTDADEKAGWLAAHPVGTNYDVREFRGILPVGITPFREFIHSTDERFWLTSRIPRVLPPDELDGFLRDSSAISVARRSPNVVALTS